MAQEDATAQRQDNPLNDLISDRELADTLGIGRGTLKGLRERGLPHLKIGLHVWYDVEAAVNWIKTNCSRTLKLSG